ncbi:MAG: polyprenyl synthetase family protein [Hyphomicrobiales bacterium]|nr:polyprenyl synthetase family protein [Hyphomicrobiales bacterium]
MGARQPKNKQPETEKPGKHASGTRAAGKQDTHRQDAGALLNTLKPLYAMEMQGVDGVIREMTRSNVPLVSEMAQYIIACGGKRLRPILTVLAAKLCGYEDGDRHIQLAASIEFIHTATLLHDDVVDESKLRRGAETANAVWGNAPSVLVGDFLLSRAFQLMARDRSPRVLRVLSNAAATITQGEVDQLVKKNDLSITHEDYITIVAAKTAALFTAACEVGAIVAGKSAKEQRALRDYGQHFGIAFQIIDDVLDYSAVQEQLGKAIGDDFREGKVTLPVLLAYQKASTAERAFWERTLGALRQQDGDLTRAISYVRESGAMEEAAMTARAYAAKAHKRLQMFPASDIRKALEAILDFAVTRPY